MAQVHYVLRTQDLRSKIGRWSLRGGLDWQQWDEEVVVRLEPSGGTYLLSALAGGVVMALHDGAADAEEIAARVFDGAHEATASVTATLTARFSAEAPETQEVLDTLAHLQTIGIVRSDLN